MSDTEGTHRRETTTNDTQVSPDVHPAVAAASSWGGTVENVPASHRRRPTSRDTSSPSPRPPRVTDPVARGGRPLCVAHRGASDVAAENTLAAVRAAVAAGADHVEVDVRRTADRALVLHHDATLVRTTDVRAVYPGRAPWRVADFTLAELARLDAGSWSSPAHAGEPVATLEDVLDVLGGTGVGLLLELKEPGHAPGVVPELAAELRHGAAVRGPRRTAVLVQSFDHDAMASFRAEEPDLEVGLLGKPRRAHLPRLATWADAVNPHHCAVDAGYVEAVHAAGMRCMVWTPNATRSLRRAVRLGVDAITTDHPARLRTLLAEVHDPMVGGVSAVPA